MLKYFIGCMNYGDYMMENITGSNNIVSVKDTVKVAKCSSSCKCRGAWYSSWFTWYWTSKGNGYRK